MKTTELAGKRTIYEVEGGFVISEHDVWMPGFYSTHEAAVVAFDHDDDQLSKLQDMANARGGDGTISLNDLRTDR